MAPLRYVAQSDFFLSLDCAWLVSGIPSGNLGAVAESGAYEDGLSERAGFGGSC